MVERIPNTTIFFIYFFYYLIFFILSIMRRKLNYRIIILLMVSFFPFIMLGQCVLTNPTVTSSAAISCPNVTVNLSGTTAIGSMRWFTQPSGGTALGTSISGANFAVTPSSTTTYYGEAFEEGIQTYNFTGGIQTFTVPQGVTELFVQVWGAQGGSGANGNSNSGPVSGGAGGLGGYSEGTLAVTPGDVLNIFVGGQGATPTGGFNGGANGGSQNAGGGGGATDIRVGGTSEANRVIVAGGGGGGARGGCEGSQGPAGTGGNGGSGGGGVGVDGGNSPTSGGAAGGGRGGNFGATQGASGPAGVGCSGFLGSSGAAASTGTGGTGGAGQSCCCFSFGSIPGGGGGGGGFLGGGGGGGGSAGTAGCSGNDKGGGGGGGGGSSHIGGVSNAIILNGIWLGNGMVTISWDCKSARIPTTVNIPSGPTPVVTLDCNVISADWSVGAQHASYVVTFKKISPVMGAPVSYSVTGTSKTFTVSAANFGSTYEVIVKGRCGNQYSPPSVAGTIAVPDPRPAAPTGFTFSSPNCNTIISNWNASPGASAYRIVFKNPVSNTIAASAVVAGTTYTRTGLNPGTPPGTGFEYDISVTPIGCNNIRGFESQHFLVRTCTGVTTPLRVQAPDPELVEEEELFFDTDAVIASPISVYPNPNNGEFTISMSELSDEKVRVEIIDIIGKVIYSQEVNVTNGAINHEARIENEQPAGTYLVRIISENNGTFVSKFVKM